MCMSAKMDTPNVKNKRQDNRLTTRGHFRQPRQDYLQDSVSQCNAAVDKESLCKVSDYEVSVHSKFNLPNIDISDGKGRAIYWLYKHNLADSQSIRERLKAGNKIFAIGNFMQVAREKPDTFLKRLRLKRDLCNLREMFLKGENSEIEIKETYNSYLNLDDIYSLHLYLKSNEPLSTDQYQNLALNLEIKGNLLKEIQKTSRKCKQEYILPESSRTNAQKNQRVYLENYISKYKAASAVSGGKSPSKTVIYPFQVKSKADQKQKNAEPDGDKETNILTRSGLSINDLEHILNQINFIIKGEHLDQETEMQKTKLQRYLHSISTESNICEVKKENNLCILDRKISEGLQNSMRDLIKQLAFQSKTSSLKTESNSCKITNDNPTCAANSLKKCRAKSNIFISSSGTESSSNEKMPKGPKTKKKDQSLTCFKCESSDNTSSDENLYSNICMKSPTPLCKLNQNHKDDPLREYELAAKQISQELAQIKRNRSQGDNMIEHHATITKNKSKEKKAPDDDQKKIDGNYAGDAATQGQPLPVDVNQETKTKRRSRSPNFVNIKLKEKVHKSHDQDKQKSEELGRYKEVEGKRCTQEEENTDYEDSGQYIDIKQEYNNTRYSNAKKHLNNRHTASQTDHRERRREESSNTEERLSFFGFKQNSKVDSAEQYRIQDIGQSCKEIYKDQPTQYQSELFAQSSSEEPIKDEKMKKAVQVKNSKTKKYHVENYENNDDKRNSTKNKEGRYSPVASSYKNYLGRIHKKKTEDVGDEARVSLWHQKPQNARGKQEENYLCFEDELQISSDSFCNRARKNARTKLQPQKQAATKSIKQQIESLDDLIERMDGIRSLKSKTWTGIPQASSNISCKESKSDKKLIKSYQEDISNKMARNYDYFTSPRKKRKPEKNMGEEYEEEIHKDSEELIEKIDYDNYFKRSQEKCLVNRILTNNDVVSKYQSKRKILRTINEKETADEDSDFKYQEKRSNPRKQHTKSKSMDAEVLKHQVRRSNSEIASDEENVGAFKLSKYRCKRSASPNPSEREYTDVGDDLKNRNRRSTYRNVSEREDGGYKYRSKGNTSENRNQRDEVDDLGYRNKRKAYGNPSETENDNFKHRNLSQNDNQRGKSIEDEDHFKYPHKRNFPELLNERKNIDVEDDFEFRKERKISEDDYVNIDDVLNYQSREFKEGEDVYKIDSSSLKQSSSVAEETSTTMTNSVNLYNKSTDELIGAKTNPMDSDVSGRSLSSLEKFLLDERACKIDSGKLETANTYPSEIPIYKEGCEIARLTHGSQKTNKSTQMFEHVTKNDLYTLQWIHDNLFEININPHTLIVDEKIKEVSEESRLS